jgi:hypothetical protein
MFANYIETQVNVYKSYLLAPKMDFSPTSDLFSIPGLDDREQISREHAVISFQTTTGVAQPPNRIRKVQTDLSPFYVSTIWRFASESANGYANWGTAVGEHDGPMYLYTDHDYPNQQPMRFSHSVHVRHVGTTGPITFELRKEPKIAELFLRLETPEMQRPANLNTDIAGNASWSIEVIIARMLKNSYVGNGLIDTATLVGSKLMVPWMLRLIKLMIPAFVPIPMQSTSCWAQVNLDINSFTYIRPYKPKPSFAIMDSDIGTDPWSQHNFYYCGLRDYSTFLAGGSNVSSTAIARARGARPIFLEIDMFTTDELQLLISSFILDYAFYREFRPIYTDDTPVQPDGHLETKLPGYRYFTDNWKIPDSAGASGSLQSWIIVDIGSLNRVAPPPFLAEALGGTEYIRSMIDVLPTDPTDAIFDNTVYDIANSGAQCKQLLAKLVPLYGESIELAFSFLENKLLGAHCYPIGRLDMPVAENPNDPPATSTAYQVTINTANQRPYTYKRTFGPDSDQLGIFSSEKALVHSQSGLRETFQNQMLQLVEPVNAALLLPGQVPSNRSWFNPNYDSGRIRAWPFSEANSTMLTDATFSSKIKPAAGIATKMIYEYIPAESSENMLVARLLTKVATNFDLTGRIISMVTACYENFTTMQTLAELGMPAIAFTHARQMDRFKTCNLFTPQGADLSRAHLPNRCSTLRTAMRAAGVDRPVATRNDFGRDAPIGLDVQINVNAAMLPSNANYAQNLSYRTHIMFGGWLTMHAEFDTFLPHGFFFEPQLSKQRELLSEDLMVQLFQTTQVFSNAGLAGQQPVVNYIAGASTAIRALTLQTIGTEGSIRNVSYIQSTDANEQLALIYHINPTYQQIDGHDRYAYQKVQLCSPQNNGGLTMFYVTHLIDAAGTTLQRGTSIFKQITSLQTKQSFKQIIIQPSLHAIAPYSL